MSDEDRLLEADRVRRESMVSGDVERLSAMLSDDLVWTHSSGKMDDKESFLKKIETRAVVYQSLEPESQTISQHGDVMICHGTLIGSAAVDGKVKNLRSRFLSVWQRSGNSFEMLAWQSTGF
ncbi:MAG: nuclear transport factor 2 family protein [Pseudomonadales bacterium]